MAEFAEEARDGRAGEVLRRGDAEFSREVFADAREKDEPSARGAGVSRGGVGARGGAAVGGDARGGGGEGVRTRATGEGFGAGHRRADPHVDAGGDRLGFEIRVGEHLAEANLERRARALQGVHARARDARDALESFALVALETLGPDRV